MKQSSSIWASFSDLMAAFCFIFLLLLASLVLYLQEESQGFQKLRNQVHGPKRYQSILLGDIAELLKNQGLKVEVIPQHGLLRLQEPAWGFAPGKATVPKQKEVLLAQVAKSLSTVLGCSVPDKRTRQKDQCYSKQLPYVCRGVEGYALDSVTIEGHTDSLPVLATSGFADNLSLSAARAAEVYRQVEHCQPNIEGWYNSDGQKILSVAGYADTRLAYSNPRNIGNRRIDIRIRLATL